MREGTRVTYIGPGEQGLALGERGQVIAGAQDASHVLWSTGAVTLTDDYDLTPTGKPVQAVVHDGLDDSLEVGTIGVTAARQIYDESGEHGLLTAMVNEGHLVSFGAIIEEATTLVSTRIRNDPSFQAVMASLEDEEGEALVRLATTLLLHDASQED